MVTKIIGESYFIPCGPGGPSGPIPPGGPKLNVRVMFVFLIMLKKLEKRLEKFTYLQVQGLLVVPEDPSCSRPALMDLKKKGML